MACCPDSRVALARACRRRAFAAREVICDLDTPERDVMFIVEGTVTVSSYSRSGREIAFAELSAGQYFGEIAAIDGLRRSAVVTGKVKGVLLVMPADRFRALLVEQPETAWLVMMRLTGLIRASNERVQSFTTQSVTQRVCLELLGLSKPSAAVSGAVQVVHPMPTQADLGSRLGASRETVARVLLDLAQDGLIVRKGRTITIPDDGAAARPGRGVGVRSGPARWHERFGDAGQAQANAMATMATAPGGRGAVAAGHDATAAAAVEILSDGGNAFDAVVAALAASFVVEPALSSPGGGGFLMAHPAGTEPRVLDFFTQTPGGAARDGGAGLDFLPLNADFGPATQEFHVGRAAAAVPGMVPGLCAIQRDLGRLPLARLLAPAVRMARAGVPMAPLQAHIIGVIAPILTLTEAARVGLRRGDRRGRPHHRAPLRPPHAGAGRHPGGSWAAKANGCSATARWRGPWWSCARDGGLTDGRRPDPLCRALASDRWSGAFAGARVLTNPPPSAGGALIAFGLALADDLAEGPGPGDLATIMHLTTEARDATGLNLGVDEARVSALCWTRAGLHHWRALKRGGTTHMSRFWTAEGNAAACTVSNGEGCGHMVPGTGFMLNNMLGEEDLNPAGFFRWAPDTRVASMMAPTLAERPDGRVLALGSGGSNRIRTALLQVLCAVLARGESLDEAVAAPRLHVERGHLDIEAGWPDDIVAELTADWPDHRVWPDRSMFYGGVHAVERAADGTLTAVGDPRRGGAAAIAV